MSYKKVNNDFSKKYDKEIRGIAQTNNVDMGVAKDMFMSNIKNSGSSNVYKGGGKVDDNRWSEMHNDYDNVVRAAKEKSNSKAYPKSAVASASYSGGNQDLMNMIMNKVYGNKNLKYDIPDRDNLMDNLNSRLSQRELAESAALEERKNRIINALTQQKGRVNNQYDSSVKDLNDNQYGAKENMLEGIANKGIKGGLVFDQETKLQNKLLDNIAKLEGSRNLALEDIGSQETLANSEYASAINLLKQQLAYARDEGESNIESLIRQANNQQTDFDYRQNNDVFNKLMGVLNVQNTLSQQDFQNSLALDQFDRAILESDRAFDTDNTRWQSDQGWKQKMFDYSAERDAIGDDRWNQQFNYNALKDSISDSRWGQQFNYNAERDKIRDQLERDKFEYQKTLNGTNNDEYNDTFSFVQDRIDKATKEEDPVAYLNSLKQYINNYRFSDPAIKTQLLRHIDSYLPKENNVKSNRKPRNELVSIGDEFYQFAP